MFHKKTDHTVNISYFIFYTSAMINYLIMLIDDIIIMSSHLVSLLKHYLIFIFSSRLRDIIRTVNRKFCALDSFNLN